MSDIAALFTWVSMRFLLREARHDAAHITGHPLLPVVLGTVVSRSCASNARVLRAPATVCIEIFKNAPLLL